MLTEFLENRLLAILLPVAWLFWRKPFVSLDLDFGNLGERGCACMEREREEREGGGGERLVYVFREAVFSSVHSVVCIYLPVLRKPSVTNDYHCFVRKTQFLFSHFM